MYSLLYQALRSELEEWIQCHRIPRVGPLDIAATAAGVGHQVEYSRRIVGSDNAPRDVKGALIADGTAILNPDFASEYRITYGHELGHWVIRVELPDLIPTGQRIIFVNNGCGDELMPLEMPPPAATAIVPEEALMQARKGWETEIEDFCERFGRELALPLNLLKRLNTDDPYMVCRMMGVDIETAFFQLYELGPIAPHFEIDYL